MEEPKIPTHEVETYAADMARILEGGQSGIIKNIIHQEEEHDLERKNLSPESRKNRFFMIAGLVFMFTAAAIFIYIVLSREKIVTVEVAPVFVPLIFTDQTAFVAVDTLLKEEIARDFNAEIKKSAMKKKDIKAVYLSENKQVINFPRFIELMLTNLPKEKAIFFNESFLLGSFQAEAPKPFILIPVKSFADVFTVMHDWEPKMFSDLHDLFGVTVNLDTNYLMTKDFEDGIVQNKNARILYDLNNKIVLMYVFVDDNSIVLSDSDEAVAEIIARLASGKIKK